ncbi:cytochrome P450 [Actinophytocola algeriensis]|uniref:Cytochrome P450 n=1 Tax=Actinophytocola algeriensis TaxID=1768010 RepID=A0A7W7VF34_9PSEU|nr:cytochrome P450 [Actinophytocola algeriensis]MBB4907754.1 cytochrome P450 [Actinophytocola algeriensis]MBE1479784.1 cytochrome P450 [Actinophytocola algeriensis]
MTTLDELTADPHPVLARLRAATPVAWVPVLDGWLVTGYGLAQQVMRDAATFTVDDPRFSTATVVGPSMLSLDGAVHARHRDPFVPPFRPAPVRDRYAAFVAKSTAGLIDALLPRGAAELRADFAGPLALSVVADALGLTGVDASAVRTWYAALVASVSAVTAGSPPTPEGAAAFRELGEHVHRTIADPSSDSLLTGIDLEQDEIVANAAVLMFGGIDTTESMIANLVLHLLSHPDALAAVRADRTLLPNAIEESLRFEPAASVVDRYATRDVTIAGADIARGDLVRVSIAGANRDPAVFAAPDTFDVHRPNARVNLAFALGPHFCLGARLARVEAEIAMTALLDRMPRLRLAEPVTPSGLVFRKPPTLPVRWD